jgi:hypothetical protein
MKNRVPPTHFGSVRALSPTMSRTPGDLGESGVSHVSWPACQLKTSREMRGLLGMIVVS